MPEKQQQQLTAQQQQLQHSIMVQRKVEKQKHIRTVTDLVSIGLLILILIGISDYGMRFVNQYGQSEIDPNVQQGCVPAFIQNQDDGTYTKTCIYVNP